ncbi:class I SAM-dependent methyltransferase [Jiella endophytica]|uniref:Class I SAM-dependent methyltransferase n=2 Tax=Jiella endophytica TaxID=2558362 RepID=A0A4Y8RHC7_9HYPH|nr:class I SAM-dependent methyltransferase [Jiella endophytica]
MSTVKPSISIDEQSLITSELFRGKSVVQTDDNTDGEILEYSGKLSIILELAKQGFENARPAAEIVARLAGDLHQMRATSSTAVWEKLVAIAQDHPVAEFLAEDPLSNWSFTKPRGYSGDASLLDLYYQHPSMASEVAEATPRGREIYDYTVNVPACAAGRERCQILARTVDEAAERAGGDVEIFAVAAGHLREAEICKSLPAGKIKRWVALDQDPVSVGVMTRDIGGAVVQPMTGSVMGLLKRSYGHLGDFDLVYASGLYDYLQRKVAIKLMQRMVEFVRPGGMLLFANFSDEITSDGYMETFMDWPLILRSADDMWDIINASVDRNAFDCDVWYGTNRNIVYGTLRRK